MRRLSARAQRISQQVVLHSGLVIVCLYVLVPLSYLVLNSLKSNYEVITDPFGLPSSVTFSNYRTAWASGGLASAMLNTAIVAAVSASVIAVLAALTSFSLCFLRMPGGKLISGILMLTMQVPLHMYIVPLFVQWRNLHLVNNPLGIMIIYSAVYLPFSILFLNSQFAAIPIEIIEAAEIDGCSHLRALLQIVVPLTRPAFVTMTLINVKWIWNEFPLSITFLQEPAFQTVTPRYMQFSARFLDDFAITSAGAVISALPIVVLYLLLQRRFMEGMTQGSLKG